MERRFIRKFSISLIISVAVLVTSVILGVALGNVRLSLKEIFDVLFGAGSEQARTILFSIRLPRVLVAAVAGACLAAAGVILQSLLVNPLASPFTLGISSGASLGAVCAIYLSSALGIGAINGTYIAIAGVLGAFLTLMLLLLFVSVSDKNYSTTSVVLSGMIISLFLNSLVSLIMTFAGNELRQMMFWTLGSLSMRGYEHLLIMLPFFAIAIFFSLFLLKELNALSMGDEGAISVGVDIKKVRFFLLLLSSVLTGAAVSVVGPIGFIGLVVPHTVRLLTGGDHRILFPVSAISGAAALILCDIAARTIAPPQEISTGVISAIVGVPVFAIVYFYSYRRN